MPFGTQRVFAVTSGANWHVSRRSRSVLWTIMLAWRTQRRNSRA
jgi:hypothetical protein